MENRNAARGTGIPFPEGIPLKIPLPLPKKRKHAPMDFDIEPVHDGVQDEFDFEPYPSDDFDL